MYEGYVMFLSKSRYCEGMQCPKMLWLKKNRPEEFDVTILDEQVLLTGDLVGDLAMGLFGHYVEVAHSADISVMIQRTQDLIDAGTPIIAEASFDYRNNFCSVDILVNEPDGVVIAEVKSSTASKENYLHDLAYQVFVLSGCGLLIKKVLLVHINSDYVRQGELDIQTLFTIEDMTQIVSSMLPSVTKNIDSMTSIAESCAEPKIDIGPYCTNPFDCGFQSHCWHHLPSPSIFDIAKLKAQTKFDAYYQGVITYPEILQSSIKLNDRQLLQIEAEVNKSPLQINSDGLRRFLDDLNYPLYFLDFETFQQAIPEFDGVSPYMQIPFQYSLHVQKARGGELEHLEYLAPSGIDPRRGLAEQLVRDIPKCSCILAYNMSFEKGVITRLSRMYPDLEEHLMSLPDGFRDLMVPFQKMDVYSHEMAGSHSIKKVLPALCGDDPELHYDALNGIHNGGEAMSAYATLASRTPEDAAQIRKDLLAYCRLDTLAMVKIREKLNTLVNDPSMNFE